MNYKRLFIPNSIIFITIVTEGRQPLLVRNVDILKKSIDEARSYYNFHLCAYAILQNHCHLLLEPKNIDEYPKIIRAIKYNFKNNVGIAIPTYQNKKIWQNRYYEHTIRNENDLNKHIDYIHYNAIKHKLVTKAKDWQHSSFKEFVKSGFYDLDWYNMDDRYEIINCDYE